MGSSSKWGKMMLKCLCVASLCLLLAGCLEDKGALVAQCQLDYQNNPKLAPNLVSQDVMLCMRVKGFNFENRYVDDDTSRPNTKCYEIIDGNGRATPTEPFYNSPSCYYSVSFWDKLKGEE